MGKSILSKGKTVDEAVEIALNRLSAKKDEVDIEIIAHESKGLMGLLSKPAIVRVTARNLIPIVGESTDTASSNFVHAKIEALEVDQLEMGIDNELYTNEWTSIDSTLNEWNNDIEDLSGKAWVQEGILFCKDAPDKYPMVTVDEEVLLFKNDEPVYKRVLIREEDNLRVELQDSLQESKWELIVSDNNMEATLKIIPGARVLRRLKDVPPGDQIRLEIEEKRETVNIDSGPIMDKLKEMGIVSAIDFSEIARACTSEVGGSFIIAKGILPTPGKNGYFTLIEEVEVKKGLIEKDDGTIDYREIQQFPSVEKGQIIGVVNLPVPGTNGLTLTNQLLLPPEVQPLVVKLGKGAIQVDDGKMIAASEAGHPEVKIKGLVATVSVVPKLMVNKDVDLHTGNVHFTGDVEVSANVQEGMLVEAQGNVLVKANVHSATIVSGKSIIVHRNVISSEITAGQGNMLNAQLTQMLDLLIVQLKQMAGAISQLSTISTFHVTSSPQAGLGPIIRTLCEGKFKSTRTLINDIIRKVMAGTEVLDREWVELCAQLNKGFIVSLSSSMQTMDDLYQFIQASSDLLISLSESSADQSAFIHAGFIHNSQLYSSGDIILVGKGSYNSKLHAEGVVEVEGTVRGGEIYGARGVRIGETGSRGGNITKIMVSNEATIKIKKAMEDTVIQIGPKTYKFMIETAHVVARLDKDGNISIS